MCVCVCVLVIIPPVLQAFGVSVFDAITSHGSTVL